MRQDRLLLRPVREEDKALIDEWRKKFANGELEIPHGYTGPSTDTIVAEKDGKIVLSVTGSLVMVFDPLVINPEAKRLDVMEALLTLARAFEYIALKNGAAAAFTAVPDELEHYQRVVAKGGYEPTALGCTIFRRVLQGPSQEQEVEQSEAPEVTEEGDLAEKEEVTYT